MKNACIRLAAATLAAVAFSVAGCQSTKKAETKASPSVMNTTCPVSHEPIAADQTVDYKGGKVGFCCKNCQTKWAGMTDAQRDAALAKAK